MSQNGPDRTELLRNLDALREDPGSWVHLKGSPLGIPEAWFLGPKAENKDVLNALINEALLSHYKYREAYQQGDPKYIPELTKQFPSYESAVKRLMTQARILYKELQKSAPIFSMRHHGHMLWDQVLPAIAGYFAAMLYNQNNVAAEASPLTTLLEMEVGNELCRMLGYKDTRQGAPPSDRGQPVPWGHITCDGSVANIEALWAARNAKFFPIALRAAIREEPALARAREIRVKLLDDSYALLTELDTWTMLNLGIDDIVGLPYEMELLGITPETTNTALTPYAVQNIGLLEFYQRFMSGISHTPVVMVPSTRHYSWPKGAALLGLGQNNIMRIHVDLQARMDIHHLIDALDLCLRKRVPVLAVVAVIGSTEESTIDPLVDILEVRKQFRKKGLDFAVHCDAAWGGYFASMLRDDREEAALGQASQEEAAAVSATPAPREDGSSFAAASSEREVTDASPLGVIKGFDQFFRKTSASSTIHAVSSFSATSSFSTSEGAEVPAFSMNDYVTWQYKALKHADSITVDPHKAGYAPYPAGALCYRNSAMRDLVSLRAPVVFHDKTEPTVGIYGIEGSKPGAAAAAVWLAHKVIRPTRGGYGYILGRCIWNSKRLYCRLFTMKERYPQARYEIEIFQMLPAVLRKESAQTIQAEKSLVREFATLSNARLLEKLGSDPAAMKLFSELGSDQVILAYTFNYRDQDGELNHDLQKMNDLNKKIFEICSITDPREDPKSLNLIVTSSQFDVESYGKPFVDHYCERLGVTNPDNAPITFLISTTMDPWLTDTEEGDFLEKVESALSDAVQQAIAEID
jgi:glutamate/tyrosine decarboxylase-like PLP-dependent enzyme